MASTSALPVMGRDGLLGYVDPEVLRRADVQGMTSIQLLNGSRMSVPREALQLRDGGVYLPVGSRDIAAADAARDQEIQHEQESTAARSEPSGANDASRGRDAATTESERRPIAESINTGAPAGSIEELSVVIPVVEERLDVGRKQIETGGVRVVKDVHEKTETVDEPVIREVVNVERVAVNRVVDSPPDVREEGATVIIPVVEELLVVEKRLVLREEVRVTRTKVVTREPRTVTLRREEAEVQRWNHDGPLTDGAEAP